MMRDKLERYSDNEIIRLYREVELEIMKWDYIIGDLYFYFMDYGINIDKYYTYYGNNSKYLKYYYYFIELGEEISSRGILINRLKSEIDIKIDDYLIVINDIKSTFKKVIEYCKDYDYDIVKLINADKYDIYNDVYCDVKRNITSGIKKKSIHL